MAEIVQQQKTRGRRRYSAVPVRVDMTPLVDLAFLLLTFFVLTAELSKQNAITVKYPIDSPEHSKANGITILVGKDPEKISWYRGEFNPSVHLNNTGISKNGLLNVLAKENEAVCAQVYVTDRQHRLGLLSDADWTKRKTEILNMKSMPTVVVKWNDVASYQTIVSVIDNLNSTNNKKYAIVQMSDAEKELIK